MVGLSRNVGKSLGSKKKKKEREREKDREKRKGVNDR